MHDVIELNEDQGRNFDDTLRTKDYEKLWSRESKCCPGAKYSLFFEVEKGMKRGHLLAVYEGDSCGSLEITYQEAMKRS